MGIELNKAIVWGGDSTRVIKSGNTVIGAGFGSTLYRVDLNTFLNDFWSSEGGTICIAIKLTNLKGTGNSAAISVDELYGSLVLPTSSFNAGGTGCFSGIIHDYYGTPTYKSGSYVLSKHTYQTNIWLQANII